MRFLRRQKRELSKPHFLLGPPWGQACWGAFCLPHLCRVVAGKDTGPGAMIAACRHMSLQKPLVLLMENFRLPWALTFSHDGLALKEQFIDKRFELCRKNSKSTEFIFLGYEFSPERLWQQIWIHFPPGCRATSTRLGPSQAHVNTHVCEDVCGLPL